MTELDRRYTVAAGVVLGLLFLAGAAHIVTRSAAERVRLNSTDVSPVQLESLAPLLGAVAPTEPVQLVEPYVQTPQWEDRAGEATGRIPRNSPATGWTISAILISDSRRIAVINEQLVTVGSTLAGGARLVAIESDHVVLDEPGRGRRVVRIATDR